MSANPALSQLLLDASAWPECWESVAKWPLEQFGVQPIGLCPAMFPRYRHTRGMERALLLHVPRASAPKAVAAGFEGKRNPRDSAAGPDRLIPPAMQYGKQPFWARLQLLARLTLNTRTTPPTSQLDWLSSTTAMIMLFWSRATRDLLKSFGWGIAAPPSVRCGDDVAISSSPAP